MDASARQARSRFDRDVAWSAFAMLVPIGVGLLALPVIFRNVGEQVFTLFLLSYGAISFAPSLDLGVSRTTQRRVAYAGTLRPDMQRNLVHYSIPRADRIACSGRTRFGGGGILIPGAARPHPFQPCCCYRPWRCRRDLREHTA